MTLIGRVTGHARVLSGGALLVRATNVGDLTVDEGGRAIVHGTVGGALFNRGEVTSSNGAFTISVGSPTFAPAPLWGNDARQLKAGASSRRETAFAPRGRVVG